MWMAMFPSPTEGGGGLHLGPCGQAAVKPWWEVAAQCRTDSMGVSTLVLQGLKGPSCPESGWGVGQQSPN